MFQCSLIFHFSLVIRLKESLPSSQLIISLGLGCRLTQLDERRIYHFNRGKVEGVGL